MKTFEDYLQEIHAKNYTGTDDDMPQHYEDWLSDQGVGYVMEKAEEYGSEMYEAGIIKGAIDAVNEANSLAH